MHGCTGAAREAQRAQNNTFNSCTSTYCRPVFLCTVHTVAFAYSMRVVVADIVSWSPCSVYANVHSRTTTTALASLPIHSSQAQSSLTHTPLRFNRSCDRHSRFACVCVCDEIAACVYFFYLA